MDTHLYNRFGVVAILALLLTAVSTSSLADNFEDSVLQVDEIVGGQSVADYANTWWQWTYTMPVQFSSVRDLTGEHCHVGQSGDVWFLAGGYGSSVISRRCEVPQGKYLFFPVVNMVYFPSGPQSEYTCEQAKRSAALNNDALYDIYIELDGVESWNPAHTRMSSPDCFDLLGLVPQEYNAAKIYPSASDGYWVMLKPLSVGVHTLKFRARYDREGGAFGKMVQDIEYELVVLPE